MVRRGPYPVLVAAFLALRPQAAWSQAAILLGDVDGDGSVLLQDAELLARFLAGEVPSLPRPEHADANGDGRVSITDAMFIGQFVRGLRDRLGALPPEVLTVVPSPGQKNVSINSSADVFFSRAVSSEAVRFIELADLTAKTQVPGEARLTNNSLILTFVPSEPLPVSSTFEIRVSTGVQALSGKNLGVPFQSTFITHGPGTLQIVSGNGQTSVINTVLPAPLAVKALASDGITPVKRARVTFRVEMGDGTFQPSNARALEVLTDEVGIASTSWKVGGQIGVDNTVVVKAAGFTPVIFTARLQSGEAKNLRIFSGNNQNCPTGATTTLPLVVKATDEGGNAVQGVFVVFKVLRGEGTFQGSPTAGRVTDSSATASAFFTHGTSTGITLIEASFDGMVGQAPQFTLLALAPEPTRPTAIVGTVINTSNEPLPGIKVFLASDPTIRAVTDNSGFFRLQPVPAGFRTFVIDARRSPAVNGVFYADLAFELSVIQGQDNTIQMPAILPPLDPESVVSVSGVKGGTLTLRANPLWKLVLKPGQAKFPQPDGTISGTGVLFVTSVPPDKIPMAPPEGKFSRFFVAIEPPLVRFEPPAQVTFPNADDLPAGTITEIFSFDHEVGLFTPIGFGKVNEDGKDITSLPGSGLIHGGWHLAPPPKPVFTTCLDVTLPPIRPGDACAMLHAGLATVAKLTPLGQVEFQLCGLPITGGLISAVVDCKIPPSPCEERTAGYNSIAGKLKDKRALFGRLLGCVSSKICQLTSTPELEADASNLMLLNKFLHEDWDAAINKGLPGLYREAFEKCRDPLLNLNEVDCAFELVKAHIGPGGTLGNLIKTGKIGCGSAQEWRRVINAQIGCGLRASPEALRADWVKTVMNTFHPFVQVSQSLAQGGCLQP